MGKPVPKTKKTDLPRRSAIWPLRSLAVVRKSVSHVKDGMDTASAAPRFTLIIHHSAEFVNSFRAFCRKNYRWYGAKNLGRLYSGGNKRTNCCFAGSGRALHAEQARRHPLKGLLKTSSLSLGANLPSANIASPLRILKTFKKGYLTIPFLSSLESKTFLSRKVLAAGGRAPNSPINPNLKSPHV